MGHTHCVLSTGYQRSDAVLHPLRTCIHQCSSQLRSYCDESCCCSFSPGCNAQHDRRFSAWHPGCKAMCRAWMQVPCKTQPNGRSGEAQEGCFAVCMGRPVRCMNPGRSAQVKAEPASSRGTEVVPKLYTSGKHPLSASQPIADERVAAWIVEEVTRRHKWHSGNCNSLVKIGYLQME